MVGIDGNTGYRADSGFSIPGVDGTGDSGVMVNVSWEARCNLFRFRFLRKRKPMSRRRTTAAETGATIATAGTILQEEKVRLTCCDIVRMKEEGLLFVGRGRDWQDCCQD